MLDPEDTIVAIATAPGAAGLAVVRVSGPRALAVAGAIFEGTCLETAPANSLHHGWARWPAPAAGEAADAGGAGEPARARDAGEAARARDAGGAARAGDAGAGVERLAQGARLDEVVAAVFRAPRSYTREDVVEISCHGGAVCARSVLEALIAAGARPAGPGEFTLRAFLRGRLDLVQAEAVADLVAAESSAARSLALSQLRGALSATLASLAEGLREALAEIEARVDFAEDVGGVEVPRSAVAAIDEARASLEAMLAGAPWARAIREGATVAIVGRPNVGKSSVFNALLGEPRAIVAADPGTTRDLVSEALDLAGVRVTLSDTAGLRTGGGEVESEGVARAGRALEQSAAALWVVDGSAPLADGDRRIAARLCGQAPGRPVVVALNKRDLGERIVPAAIAKMVPRADVVVTSALRGDGIGALRDALVRQVAGAPGMASAVANPRHEEALARAAAALDRAHGSARASAPGEILAVDLREALGAIGEVTGEGVDDDLLERIFRRFCVGK